MTSPMYDQDSSAPGGYVVTCRDGVPVGAYSRHFSAWLHARALDIRNRWHCGPHKVESMD